MSFNLRRSKAVVKKLKQNENIWIYKEANKMIESWRKKMEKHKKKRKGIKKNKNQF